MRFKFLVLPLILIASACGGGSSDSPSFGMNLISATSAPPALPEYKQPFCTEGGRLWTPGYWAYDIHFSDFYWIPGTWVTAPAPGLLWTPPYWAWNGSAFVFNEGWWGPQVGFYGGIVYGFGYSGSGFQGGFWQGRQFYYNQGLSNVDINVVRTVYNTTVENNTNITRVSYNGGEGGVVAHATYEQEAEARERHLPPTAEQKQHVETARTDPRLRASVNRGKPSVAATARPGEFSGKGVVRANDDRSANHRTYGQETKPSERKAPPKAEQTQHVEASRGTPLVGVTARPGTFSGKGVVKPKEEAPAKSTRKTTPHTGSNLR